MVRSRLFFACASTFLVACGSTASQDATSTTGSASSAATTGSGGASSASTTSTTGSGGSGSGSGGGPATTTLTTGIGPIPVKVGEEHVKCITVGLNNPNPVLVRKFRTTLQEGSHHMIVYLAPGATPSPTLEDCQSFAGVLEGQHPIFIAEQASTELDFPIAADGTPVTLQLDAMQTLRIELHYFDTGTTDLMVGGSVDIDVLEDSSQKVTLSDLAFWGTENIKIPPNSDYDTGVLFQQALPGTKTFAVTTHQHHLGTDMRIWYANNASDTSDLVDESMNWANPTLAQPSPALDFPAGSGKGLAYECHWVNNTPNEVDFGESVNNEMCFLWHYYYPSQGFQFCIDGFCEKD